MRYKNLGEMVDLLEKGRSRVARACGRDRIGLSKGFYAASVNWLHLRKYIIGLQLNIQTGAKQ